MGMAEHESFLASRFAPLASRGSGDWLDVRRRARRMRFRQAGLVVAATVATVVVAAPALGLHRVVVDWFRAEPAPETVQLQFSELAIGAPEGMDPGIVPNSARRVTQVHHEGKTHVLWVAPTRDGGFCHMWTERGGSCIKDRKPPPMRPPRPSPNLNPHLLPLSWSPDPEGVIQRFAGTLLATDTEHLRAEFADGEEVEIPVTWVSPPIDAGFFIYWMAGDHRRPGHHLTALTAVGPDGAILARYTFPLTPPPEISRPVRLPDGQVAELPAKALVGQARKLVDFRAENGQRVTLWVIPTTDGGRCFWHNRGGGCPLGDLDVPMAAALHPGGRPVLFSARVQEQVAAVDLRWEDGAVERVEPVEGFILREIGGAHYERGHRLEAATAVAADGRALHRQTFDTAESGIYPCDKPVDQGRGVMCP